MTTDGTWQNKWRINPFIMTFSDIICKNKPKKQVWSYLKVKLQLSRIQLLIRVSSHVGSQTSSEMKTFPAYFTWEHITCVDSHMKPQVTAVLESLSTYSTRIWSLSCVDSHVGKQSTTLSKTFSTYFTRIQLLTCVNSHVGQQVTTLSEVLATCFAGIQLLTCVDSHVSQQSITLSKLFPTYFTRIQLITCVNSHVSQQITP